LIFTERALREIFDVKIFVDTDTDLRFIRRLERDIFERGRTPNPLLNNINSLSARCTWNLSNHPNATPMSSSPKADSTPPRSIWSSRALRHC